MELISSSLINLRLKILYFKTLGIWPSEHRKTCVGVSGALIPAQPT